MTLWASSLLFLGLLVVVPWVTPAEAEDASSTADAQELNHDPSYKSEEGYYQPAYRPTPTHYGRGGYRGYQRRGGYGYPAPGGYNPGYYYNDYKEEEKQLDELDELYARLDVIQSLIKTESEALGSLEARLTQETKILNEYVFVDFLADQKTDQNQDAALTRLEAELTALEAQLTDLESTVDSIEIMTGAIMASQENSQSELATQERVDTNQEGQIANLLATATDLKEKLLTVMDNRFKEVDDKIERERDYLDAVRDKETDRMCEVGQVTLDADDRKAEYLFQSSFQYIPDVVYSLCGYNFDLDVLENSKGYGGYGGYRKTPNTLGVTVTGMLATRTGVTFEGFDLSFGDSALRTVDVCFQACSIGHGHALAALGEIAVSH